MLTLGPRVKILRVSFLIIHCASVPFVSAKENGEWCLPFVLTAMLLDIFSLLNRIPSLSLLTKRQAEFFYLYIVPSFILSVASPPFSTLNKFHPIFACH